MKIEEYQYQKIYVNKDLLTPQNSNLYIVDDFIGCEGILMILIYHICTKRKFCAYNSILSNKEIMQKFRNVSENVVREFTGWFISGESPS